MASNPIEQRIEHMAELWELNKTKNNAPIIRMQCQPDEEDMLETFFTYMLATEGLTTDIAFYLESFCADTNTFSKNLLAEITETIEVWQQSEKPDAIDYEPIDWKPDYSNIDNKNKALHFIQNISTLAETMDLEDGIFVTIIFVHDNHNTQFKLWLEDVLALPISKKVKLLIHDNTSNNYFYNFSLKNARSTFTIPINLDMPAALEQTAAMGDPNEPATAYRVAYVKFMNALAKTNESATEKAAENCFVIAEKNLEKDPYWVTQLVTIKIALSNDKLQYKKKEKALEHATEAVEIAESAGIYFKNNEAAQLIVQAKMLRGTLLYTDKKHIDAYNDYADVFKICLQNKSVHIAIEAARMGSQAAKKAGLMIDFYSLLKEGILLGNEVDADVIKSSTYHYLLYEYIKNEPSKILPYDEVEEIGIRFYGDNWIASVTKATSNYLEYINEPELASS
jgi:hypothetical protein